MTTHRAPIATGPPSAVITAPNKTRASSPTVTSPQTTAVDGSRVSALGFGVASGTLPTPGRCAISSAILFVTPTGSVLVMMSAVTMSGPL